MGVENGGKPIEKFVFYVQFSILVLQFVILAIALRNLLGEKHDLQPV